MNTARHALFTWLFAHILHLIVLMTMKGTRSPDPGEVFTGVMLLLAIGMFISLPAFFFSWLFIFLIMRSSLLSIGKFFLWLFVAPLIVLFNGYFVLWSISGPCIHEYDFFCGEFNPGEDMVYFHPAAIAAFLSVVFRCRQFLKLNKLYL